MVSLSSSRADVRVERVTEPYGLSEGPHWDHRTQKLYFVDIYNQYVRRLDTATGVVTNAYIGKIADMRILLSSSSSYTSYY